ncbi:hypothetical protein OAK06_07975 [Gammaproteobacteria bacterium]|nr:hypothetical protein [Gammaproteobacteria bacterium]|tara:strand:- start:135 stop:263 length:129 start_codon:yes stop_codon:yes gene_type:complete
MAVNAHKEQRTYIKNPRIEVNQKSNDINHAPAVKEITPQIIE